MKKKLLLLLLSLLFLTGCAQKEQKNEKFTVITTIFPAYDWAREIIGDVDGIDLSYLTDKGVDLHSYQASVEDMVDISGCDLFVYVGGESDEWVEEVLDSVPNDRRLVLNLMDCLEGQLHEEETVEGMQVRGHSEHEHDEHGDHEEEEEYDEHVWLSVRNARILCEALCESLCALDKAHADQFRVNCAAYTEGLRQLDEDFAAAVAKSEFDTLLFCDRFPFRYLVEDYGLNYYAAFSGCSGDSEASFATVLFLTEKLEELGLPAVLKLEDSTDQLAKTVVGCTSAKNQRILTLNSMQSVPLTERRSYRDLMEGNLNALRAALN